MSFGGLIVRIVIQLFICGLAIMLLGGGLLWIVVVIEGLPAIFLSAFVFAPLEHYASKYGVRWLALVAIPFIGAAFPWLLYFQTANKQNFMGGAHALSLTCGAFGFSWVLSSLAVLFLSQDAPPDRRLLG
jgi:hypothetical protein